MYKNSVDEKSSNIKELDLLKEEFKASETKDQEIKRALNKNKIDINKINKQLTISGQTIKNFKKKNKIIYFSPNQEVNIESLSDQELEINNKKKEKLAELHEKKNLLRDELKNLVEEKKSLESQSKQLKVKVTHLNVTITELRNKSLVSPFLPIRTKPIESVIAHLGPTNSGKTYESLEFLKEQGKGVYTAPLRMLAAEAYFKLADELGEDKVGLVTGEEKINEHADIICCTTEMAPLNGHLLILDEVHWANDATRGSAWTKLLLAGNYNHIRLVGSPDCYPLLKQAFKDLEVKFHKRLAPLNWKGKVHYKDLEEDTIVIAFSRKTVLWIAQKLIEQYGADKVAVLYGAMPLDTRRSEINKVLNQTAKYTVATDVLGHGINLPAKTILFAETQKFNGVAISELSYWEAAQIAGRAGRYGKHGVGYVGICTGFKHLSTSTNTIKKSLVPKMEITKDVFGYRNIDKGRLRPNLEELTIEDNKELGRALQGWRAVAKQTYNKISWVNLEDINPLISRFNVLNQVVNVNDLYLNDLWILMQSPLDVERDQEAKLLIKLAKTLTKEETNLTRYVNSLKKDPDKLEYAEEQARMATKLRWAVNHFDLGIDKEEIAKLEKLTSQRVTELLAQHHNQDYTCKCGNERAPWHNECDECFQARKYSRNNWY